MAESGRQQRLKYEPYAFGLAFLALVSKIAYALSTKQQVLDPVLWLCAAVFIVSSVIYLVDRVGERGAGKKRTISTEIRVGNVRDSQITGAQARNAEEIDAKIKLNDVSGSQVTGYRETN
jgi:hypothetical protein